MVVFKRKATTTTDMCFTKLRESTVREKFSRYKHYPHTELYTLYIMLQGCSTDYPIGQFHTPKG